MESIKEAFDRRAKSLRDNGCLIWLGSKTTAGYGRFKLRGKHYAAHRTSYLIHHGPIPEGMVVCHSCDNPSCVNPAHLWIGTHADNQRDCTVKNRRATGSRHRSALYPDKIPKGAQTGRASLTPDQVREIRRLAGTMSQQKIADLFKTPQTNVSRIIRRKTWKHITPA